MRTREARSIIVSINIGGASGRDCLSGIFRFLNEGVNWRVHLFDNPMELTADSVTMADGIITEIPIPAPVQKALGARPIPVILTDYGVKNTSCEMTAERLQLNDVTIGETAFRFFSSLGAFASLVFMTDSPDKRWSIARQTGFTEAAQRSRKNVIPLILAPDGSDTREEQAILQKLARLPKPIAIFTAWDHLSMRVLGLCKTARIDVPGHAAILGVDNDEIICRGASPTLSSILPDHEALGYRAAQELRRLLNGGMARDITIQDSVRDILKRDSTRVIQPAEHLIRDAKAFISQHAAENISPQDVVQHLGISRALADLRFRELNGRTIREEIAAARIGEIKKRLMSSKNTLVEIARGCGFPNCPAFSRYFKREAGLTPTAWRKR